MTDCAPNRLEHRAYTQRNLFKIWLNQPEIRFYLPFRLIWRNQTDLRLVANQSENGKYNMISG